MATVALIFYGVILVVVLAVGDLLQLMRLLVFAVIGLISLIALKLRPIRAEDGYAALSRDRRPPVVYLRPFSYDEEFRDSPGAPVELSSTEEVIVEELGSLGPVVALRKRGDIEAGAANLAVNNDRWQAAVLLLLANARLTVLLCAGDNRHVLWELHTAMAMLAPEELLLLVPNDRKAYENFRKAAPKPDSGDWPDLHLTHRGAAFKIASWWLGRSFPGAAPIGAVIFFRQGWKPVRIAVNRKAMTLTKPTDELRQTLQDWYAERRMFAFNNADIAASIDKVIDTHEAILRLKRAHALFLLAARDPNRYPDYLAPETSLDSLRLASLAVRTVGRAS
jgi:hypothetical protein